MNADFVSILEFGASPDGSSDTSAAFAKAFAAGARKVYLPAGDYRLDHTLRLSGGAHIKLDNDTRIFANPGEFTDPAMITNNAFGDNGIFIEGGIIDGECGKNQRASNADREKPGLMFDFIGVNRLYMINLRLRNASSYHIRLGETKHFCIENIIFDGALTPPCQDGIHIGGGCEFGYISGIRALPGTMGDDLIALNADDYTWFGQNIGMKPLPIRHVVVRNVEAPDCYTVIRILSVNEEVSDCHFKKFRAGYRTMGLNFDATHRCSDRFGTLNRPGGVGNMKDCTFEDFELWYSGHRDEHHPVIRFETNSENVKFNNFRHVRKNDTLPTKTMQLCSMAETELSLNGEVHRIGDCEVFDFDGDVIESMVVSSDYKIQNIPYPEI